MNIHFLGLIVHSAHHRESAQVAYLIDAPDHEAFLLIESDYVNFARTTAAPAAGGQDAEFAVYGLTGDVTSNLMFRDVELTRLNRLPSLRYELGGGRREGVPKSKAVIFLPPLGDFEFEYFDCMAAYAHPNETPAAGDFRCRPKTVMLADIPASDDIRFAIGNDALVVHPHAELWIANICLGSGQETCYDNSNPFQVPNPHSEAYGYFYDPPRPLITPFIGGRCRDSRTRRLRRPFGKLYPFNIDIDCASSRYP